MGLRLAVSRHTSTGDRDNGDFLRGIFWLIVTPGFWIGTAGLFGWPFHLIAAYTAYHRAAKKNLLLA